MLYRRLTLLIAVKKQLSSYALNIDGVKSRILQYLKVLMIMLKVEIETLDYILSKRTTRPIYMRVQVRLNAISPYQSQLSSPAIREITVSGHTRQHLQPYKTPSPAIRGSSAAETCICNAPLCCDEEKKQIVFSTERFYVVYIQVN